MRVLFCNKLLEVNLILCKSFTWIYKAFFRSFCCPVWTPEDRALGSTTIFWSSWMVLQLEASRHFYPELGLCSASNCFPADCVKILELPASQPTQRKEWDRKMRNSWRHWMNWTDGCNRIWRWNAEQGRINKGALNGIAQKGKGMHKTLQDLQDIFPGLWCPCSFPAIEAETPHRTLPWKSHWKRSPICSCSLRRSGIPMCLLWIADCFTTGSQVDDHRNNLREIVNGIADAGAFAKDHNAALLLLRPENVLIGWLVLRWFQLVQMTARISVLLSIPLKILQNK